MIQVLRFGYIMIRIDGYETDETGSDWFCYHASSPLIFPPGFSEKNRIKLKPPSGWEDCFKWVDYFKETKSTPASVALFHPRDEVKHGFKVRRGKMLALGFVEFCLMFSLSAHCILGR